MNAHDDHWAPLRAAVPSFAAQWQRTTASDYYDPEHAGAAIAELAVHLVARVAAGDLAEYEDAARALEELYATLHEDVAGFLLSAGFLEDVIHEAEARGVPLNTLYSPLGPRARDAWRACYAWVHKGEPWPPEDESGERGGGFR